MGELNTGVKILVIVIIIFKPLPSAYCLKCKVVVSFVAT